MPLTDTAVRNAKGNGKTVKLFDVRGLYLQVSPTGGEWWRLKYRFDGKERKLALGVYPDVRLKDGRDRRDEARRLLAAGIDPSENRKTQKAAHTERAANSFEVLSREWFAKYAKTWAASHSERVVRLFERDIFPWMGGRPVADITAPEILTVVRRIEARGALETAHRSLGNIAQVFRYAVATGRVGRDPSGDLRGALPPVTKSHFAATTNPEELAKILRAMDAYEGSLTVRCALRLAPMLFVRPGELRTAEWASIDLDASEWRYTVTKTKTPHIVPLSRLAAFHPHVHPLDMLVIDKEVMSGHGFRAVARTILDEVLGVRPDFIEHQLAHSVRDPNGRAYNRTAHLPERKKMMQQWADYLDRLKAGAKVIAISQDG